MKTKKTKKKSTVYTKESSTIDGGTGEIIESHVQIQTVTSEQEPTYVKLYIEDLSKILSLGRNVDKVLYSLLKWMTYDNMLMVNAYMKKEIATELGYSEKTVSTYIETLAKNNVLHRVSRGIYQVNPHLIAKGMWKDISEMRKSFSLRIDYKESGREIKLEIKKSKSNK